MFIKKYYHNAKWLAQALFLKRKAIAFKKMPMLENIVVFAAHADDESIGCFQLLKNNPGSKVYYMQHHGSNVSESNKKVRLNEIQQICELLNAKLIMGETFVENSSVFLPCPIDWHREHLDLLQKAIVRNCRIFLYQETVPLPKKLITHGTKGSIHKKYRCLKHHYKSQNNMPWFRLMMNEWINGREAYAEVTEEQLYKLIEIRKNNVEYYESLYDYIDDLIRIRKYVNSKIE